MRVVSPDRIQKIVREVIQESELPRTLLEPISTLLRYTSSSVLGLLLGRDARATATTGAEERR